LQRIEFGISIGFFTLLVAQMKREILTNIL